MPINFSFSTSTTVVGSASANGHTTTKGWAYRHEAYKNNEGSGSRTTKQKLGQAPVSKTKIYDAQGRPLLIDDGHNAAVSVPETRRIEDVTEDEQDTEQKQESRS